MDIATTVIETSQAHASPIEYLQAAIVEYKHRMDAEDAAISAKHGPNSNSQEPRPMAEAYHRIATHFIQLFAERFRADRENGDDAKAPGTLKVDNTFFKHNLPKLQPSNPAQVEEYFTSAGLADSTLAGRYRKLGTFLKYIHEVTSFDYFQTLAAMYAERGSNLTKMAEKKKQVEGFPYDPAEVFKKVNSLDPAKFRDIRHLIGIKLACLFGLRSDPAYTKIRNYNKDTDLYIEDGVIHLRIVVKDKHKQYGDVLKVYTMTTAERTAVEQYIAKYPGRTYLFCKNRNPTDEQIRRSYSDNLPKWVRKHTGYEGLGINQFRKMDETSFGKSIKHLPPLERERLWSQFAHEHGHTLATVLVHYDKSLANAATAGGSSSSTDASQVAEASVAGDDAMVIDVDDTDGDDTDGDDTDGDDTDGDDTDGDDTASSAGSVDMTAPAANLPAANRQKIFKYCQHVIACLEGESGFEGMILRPIKMLSTLAAVDAIIHDARPRLSEGSKKKVIKGCRLIISCMEEECGLEDLVADYIKTLCSLVAGSQ